MEAECKAALQQVIGLELNPNAPALSVISRERRKKGWILLLTLLPIRCITTIAFNRRFKAMAMRI